MGKLTPLTQDITNDKEIKKAVALFKKSPDLFLGLRGLRSKNFVSLRQTVRDIKKEHPDARIGLTNLMKWKKTFPQIIDNTQLYRDFLELCDIDPEGYRKPRELLFKANERRTQVEKDIALKKEMDIAKIVLADLNGEDIPDTKKWQLIDKGRRQLDKINKEVRAGGLPMEGGTRELYQINTKILAKTKQIIFDNLGTLKVKQFQDLKVLSDIAETAFKQQRLIEGKSTENVAVEINDIYDTIIDNSDQQKIIELKK